MPPRHLALAICLAAGGGHIGNIYLRQIDWLAGHAELGMFVGDPTQRGKGYGKAALRLLVRHAFEDLGLHRLHLTLLADNGPAMRLYESCEFRVEGTLRDHAFKDGAFRDLLVMGLLAPHLERRRSAPPA